MTQEYNDKKLYNQLLYYDMVFDIEKAKKKAPNEDKGIITETIFLTYRHCLCSGRAKS